MKKNYLLPHRYMKIGLFMLVPFFIMACIDFLGMASSIEISFPYIYNDLLTSRHWFGIANGEDVFMEIWMLGVFSSLIFIALSKEKVEDEMIMQIRLQSMLFSLRCTAVIFIFETIFFFGFAYVYCLGALFYIFLIVSVLKFRYVLHKLNKIEK